MAAAPLSERSTEAGCARHTRSFLAAGLALFGLLLTGCLQKEAPGSCRAGDETCAAPLEKGVAMRKALTREELFEKLCAWLQKYNGSINENLELVPLDVHRTGGLRAKNDIEKDEVLMEIPAALHLSTPLAQRKSVMAKWISELPDEEIQSPSADLTTWVAEDMERSTYSSRSVWAIYHEALSRADLSDVLYFAPDDKLEEVRPSPSYFHTKLAKKAFAADLDRLAKAPQMKDARKLSDTSLWERASWLIQSRGMRTNRREALVPLADHLNHAAVPSATWEVLEEPDIMRITPTRDIAAGEEVTISYGEWSNSHLLYNYGFTLPPYEEPIQSFMLHMQSDASGEPSLPNLALDQEDQGALPLLSNGLMPAVLQMLGEGPEAYEKLRGHIAFYMRLYEEDKMLDKARQTWSENLRKDPGSPVWWLRFGECGPSFSSEDRRKCLRSSDFTSNYTVWEMNLVRAKMSEYICLKAYLQMLDVHAKKMQQKSALRVAMFLAKDLKENKSIVGWE